MPEGRRTTSVISLGVQGPTIYSKLIQVGVAAIFFAAMIGAFCYAILNGETTKDENSGSVPIRDASSNFSVFWTQYSDAGNCRSIKPPAPPKLKESDEPDEEDNSKQFPTYWYQDNDEQKLIFRTDETHVAYVFKTHTYWTVIDDAEVATSCSKDDTLNYGEFIKRLGLYNMYNRHSEIRKIARNAKVFVYDGEASSKKLRNDMDLPLFIRAYADYQTGVLRGFDSFFGTNTTSGIFHTQCWFDEMTSNKPSAAAWGTIPTICEEM